VPHSLPLLPAALGALSGLLLAPPGGAAWAWLLPLSLGSRRWAPLVLLLGFFGLGSWRAEPPWTTPDGVVTVRLRLGAERQGVLLGYAQGGPAVACRRPVQLAGPLAGPRGQEVVARGRLRRVRGRTRFQLRRSVHAAVAVPVRPGRAERALGGARDRVAATIDRGAPGRLNGLFKALALGDRRGVDDRSREAFARTGAAHLLAISGLHVGLVALGVGSGLRWGLRRAWRGPGASAGHPDRLALVGGLVAASSYVAVAGAPVSGQRALVMLSLAAVAQAIGRRAAVGNALLAAVLGVAWLDPAAVREPGLLLSAASVAGLLVAGPATARLARRPGIRLVAGSAVASFAATVATGPLCLLFFGRVGLAGLWVNPLVVPLLGAATLPPLLAGAALGLVSPSLGAPLVALATVPAGLGLDAVLWLAEPARAPQLVGALSPVAAACCYVGGAAVVWLIGGRS